MTRLTAEGEDALNLDVRVEPDNAKGKWEQSTAAVLSAGMDDNCRRRGDFD